MATTDIKEKIKQSIQTFSTGNLTENALNLFKTLGYNTQRQAPLDKPDFTAFKDAYIGSQSKFNEEKALAKQWKYVDLLFQLSKEEMRVQHSLFNTGRVDNTIIESYLFFAIELTETSYSRTALGQITREINRLFSMPVMVLFKHGQSLTLAVINRRLHKRDENKDVLEKITLIKDIQIEGPHRAHIEILFDLSFKELSRTYDIINFQTLHEAWRRTLDISELNKRFYREVANWYFWASKNVEFPADEIKDETIRNATCVIRLLTRLIFVWFLKEKCLVPDELFNRSALQNIINFKDKNNSAYYKAILQNLFFATLNTEMNKDKPGSRKFRHRAKEADGRDQHYMIHNVFRYEDYFIESKATLKKYFDNIPFLNGGLFECLDKEEENKGKKIVVRIDGFSDHPKNTIKVPDKLFFSDEQPFDLNETYGTKNKKYTVRGIIDILDSYKFTIDENTPIEEEIALDPELLGKVFENLLASYNPETGSTARKQTGSFYTPREIVNYMVDESLIAYLENKLIEHHEAQTIYGNSKPPKQVSLLGESQPRQIMLAEKKAELSDSQKDEIQNKVRQLIAYTEEPHQFNSAEVMVLIEAIDSLKILDPACGSGAFPMGILHKLVYILNKLDPENKQWKQTQIKKIREVPDITVREKLLEDIEHSFHGNELDYGRKLYLIENCIYGVDIQPIAVQIAKLRFFISLIVDQKVNSDTENLGIRPLPNLETKFVSANTLIGIDKKQLAIRNPEIERKEKELKEVRKAYFTARTPKTKDKYRREDQRLRLAIAELLQNDGWSDKTARQIASWNPYDQNASLEFFDPEWMFGVKDGFDVVIGNPPFYQLAKDYKIPITYKKYLRERYKTSGGRLNTFIFFIHQGIEILSYNAVLCFIVPNTILTQDYYRETRKLLLESTHLRSIIVYDKLPFENAVVENVTLLTQKNTCPDYLIRIYSHDTVEAKHIADKFKSSYRKSESLVFTVTSGGLSDKIYNLRGIVFIGEHFHVNQAIALKGDKSLSIKYKNTENKYYKLLDGRNISKYNTKWAGEYLDYNLERIHSCKTKEIFLKSEKILFRRVSQHLICAYDNKKYFALNTLVVITEKTGSIPLKYLLGLMNSYLFDYIYLTKYKSTKTVFSEIQARSIEKLPVLKACDKAIDSIIELVDKILIAKKDESSNTLPLETLLDARVAHLYELTEEEYAIVLSEAKCSDPFRVAAMNFYRDIAKGILK